jgi:NTE family protein
LTRRTFTNRNLRQSRPLVGVALGSGREIWLRDGSLLDACRASIALPGLFAPFRRSDDSLLVDGALVNPVPVSLARALGADVVIAVNLNGDLVGPHFFSHREQADEIPEPGLFDVLVGSIDIMQDRITRSRMAGEPPDIHITPRLSHIGLMDFQRR